MNFHDYIFDMKGTEMKLLTFCIPKTARDIQKITIG